MDTRLSFNRVEQLKGFIESNPDDPFTRYGLAMELKKLGRHDEAREAFARAASMTENARERDLLLARAAAP